MLLATGGLACAADLLLAPGGQNRAALDRQSRSGCEWRRSVRGPDYSHVIQGLIVDQREALGVSRQQATEATEDGLDGGVTLRVLGY